MKSLKLKKIIALAVAALTITALSPVGASAQWKQDSHGWWNTEGNSYSIGWKLIDGTWYYFDSTGYMKTGWVNDNGTWYYMQPSGAMKTGWEKDGGTWYYMQSSGAMKTGWVNDNGTWYYLQSSGAMKTGWINDNGTWYFASESGAMQTGVVQVDGKIYYLAPSGAMAIGTVTINGVVYTFDANGAAVGDKLPTVAADKAFNGNGSTATVSTPVVQEETPSNNSSGGGGGSSAISPSRLNTVGTYTGNCTITDNTGTFGPASGTSTLQGNVSISNANAISGATVTLKNLNITGTLTIDFGAGNVVLDNVVVNGVNVSNVGTNSLHVRGNSRITTLRIQDANNDAHIVLEGNAAVTNTNVLAGATLEVAANASAHFANITLSPALPTSPITFTGNLGTTAVVVNRPSSNVVVGLGTVLQSITANAGLAVSGTGTINSVAVAAPGANITLGLLSIGTVNVNSAAVGAILNLTATVTNLNISAPNANIQGSGTIIVANIGANGIILAQVPTTVAVLSSANVTSLNVGGISNYQSSGNVIIIHSMPAPVVTSSFQSEIQAKYAKYALVNINKITGTNQFEVKFVEKDDSNTDSNIGGDEDYVTHDILVTNPDGTDKDITYDSGVYTAPEGSILYSTVRVYRAGEQGGQIGYVTIPYVVK